MLEEAGAKLSNLLGDAAPERKILPMEGLTGKVRAKSEGNRTRTEA